MKRFFPAFAGFLGLFLLVMNMNAQDYEYNWNPDRGSVYGDPLPINKLDEVFVSIGTSLPPGVFSLEDVWFRMNDGLWHSGIAAYSQGAEYPYDVKLNSKVFSAQDDSVRVILKILEIASDEYLYDTVHYLYSSPQLEIITIDGEPFDPEIPVVPDPETSNLSIGLHAWALFGEESQSGGGNDFGDARIREIEISTDINFTNLKTLNVYPDYDVTNDFNVFDYFTLSGGDLVYGHNGLYMRAVGMGGDKSEIVTLPFFIFDFEFGQSVYCKYDSLYQLQGKPKGGKFSGECILEETKMFNPSLAESFSTTVLYEFVLDGYVFQKEKSTEISDLPLFNLEGPRQVCGNEHGATYSISGEGDLTVQWSVSEESVVDYEVLSDGSLFINWAEHGTGYITASITTENGCSVRNKYIIDIGKRQAPKDSAYLILNDRMLICSDTNVNYYYWYHATNNTLLGTTHNQNYYEIPFQPAVSDSFYVMTAYDTLGCTTHSYFSKAESSQKMYSSDLVNVAPNPTSGMISFQIPPHPDTRLKVVVYHVDGRLVYSQNLKPKNNFEDFYIDLGSFKNGIYMLYLYGNEISFYRKVVLAK